MFVVYAQYTVFLAFYYHYYYFCWEGFDFFFFFLVVEFYVARTYHGYIIDFRYTSNEYVDAHNGGTIWRIIHIDRPFCTMCKVINKFNNWPATGMDLCMYAARHLLGSHLNLASKICVLKTNMSRELR